MAHKSFLFSAHTENTIGIEPNNAHLNIGRWQRKKKSKPDIKLCDWMSRMKQYIHNHKYDLYFFFFCAIFSVSSRSRRFLFIYFFITARTNWLRGIEVSAAALLFWVYSSYLFLYCVSACGESPSSLRCSSSNATAALRDDNNTSDFRSFHHSYLQVGDYVGSTMGPLAALPQWPRPTYLAGSPAYEINT